jgi:hypothetical protein
MIIKLGNDRFWVAPSNIERWPEILKKLPVKIECHSKYDMAKRFLSYRSDEKGRILKADEFYGLFGAEKTGNIYSIAGCNLIRNSEKGYELTENALELVKRYDENNGWEKYLGEQLLKYSIRTRSIAVALINGGYMVLPDGFKGLLWKGYVFYEDKKYHIFSSNSDSVNINSLLNSCPEKALGNFWIKEININAGEPIEFKGINRNVPSLSSMSTYIKIPLLLFDYLKWLKQDNNGRYIMNREKLKEDLPPDTWESITGKVKDKMEIFKDLINRYSDARGFFPAGIAGSLLKNEIDEESKESEEQWIDRFFMTGINEGKFKIVDNEQGQPRHGRGFLGKKEYQLLKLKFREER